MMHHSFNTAFDIYISLMYLVICFQFLNECRMLAFQSIEGRAFLLLGAIFLLCMLSGYIPEAFHGAWPISIEFITELLLCFVSTYFVVTYRVKQIKIALENIGR